MATDTLEQPATLVPALAAAEALHTQASDTYDVLAVLSAICTLGECAVQQDESVNADTLMRLASMAHDALSCITKQLFAIEQQLRKGANHG